MAITAAMRKRAEAIPHREKKRLRRNFLMWEGRLERSMDHLNYLQDERKLPKQARMFEKSAKQLDESIEDAKNNVIECHGRLQRATDEINDALGSNVTIPVLRGV